MKLCMGCMEAYEDEYSVCPHCGYAEDSEPEEANQLRPGTILHNKFVVGKAIGHGGFGVTYLGYDAELERKVAIKEYMPNEFSNRVPGEDTVIIYEGDKREQFESGLVKFTEEAQRLAKFQDREGIVQIFDCFRENNTAYLVMEYLDGITAKEKIRRDGRMSLEEALGVIMPILRSLKEVNAAGILHRDIAPDNVMLTKDGGAKLIDFGASRFATTGHSRSLTVLIKQGYAPVEQYNSRGDQGTWTDVYGLAATFYFLLTGKTPQDAMERKAHDQLKPPSKEGADVKKNIDVAILNAMNVGIEYRTKTMEDFEKELMSIEEVARVVEPEHREDLGKMPKWLKAVLASAAVLLVVFGVLLVTGVINFGGVSSGVFQMASGKTYVPAFVNQFLNDAKNIADKNQIVIQFSDSDYSDEVEKDMVMGQSMPSGSEVVVNSMVNLVVSAGRKKIEVPEILGYNVQDAVAIIQERGLQAETVEVDSNEEAGSVVSQSIAGLTLVDAGTKIVLEFSNGNVGEIDENVEVTMPNLVKKKYEDASKTLGELGLTVSRETQYSNDVPAGYVISQSELEGTILRQGDKVKLIVSLGKQKVNVPYVLYKTEEEAKSTLESVGLTVAVNYEYNADVPKGKVSSQNPNSDAQVEIGTKVSLVVSMGAKETQVVAATPTPEPKWSDWADNLPNGVSNASHEIETRVEYRYREQQTQTANDQSLAGQGWTQTDAKSVDKWSDWSGWSDQSVTKTSTRDVATRTMYRSKTKQTTTSTDANLKNQGWTLDSTDTNYSDYGAWSGWDANNPKTSTDLMEVQSQAEYQYRDRTSSQSSAWTDWSAWQDAPVGATATREVRTQQVDDPNNPIYTTYYNYDRWYRAKDDMTSPRETMRNAEHQWAGWSETPKQYVGESSIGGAMYDGRWYNEITEQRVTGYNKKTQYSYHDYVTNTTYSWGDWSGWSTTAVSANDNRQVNTRTRYRNRTRTVSYTYHYSKWSDWSGWSETAVSGSSTVQVDTKTQYRYRDKTTTTTYTFTKWGDWSNWSSSAVTASTSRQVETRTYYRWKAK